QAPIDQLDGHTLVWVHRIDDQMRVGGAELPRRAVIITVDQMGTPTVDTTHPMVTRRDKPPGMRPALQLNPMHWPGRIPAPFRVPRRFSNMAPLRPRRTMVV